MLFGSLWLLTMLGMVPMGQEFYSPVEVEQLLGISRPAARTYANRYGAWLSPEASPEPGLARRFRIGDLRVLAFVYYKTTKENQDHDQVMAVLAEHNGVPASFTWQLEADAAASPTETEEEPSTENTALVPVAALRAAQALMQDARNREESIADRLAALQEENKRLNLELGEARGALGVYRGRKRPKWWIWLFGGE
jgi:hypothetical protein